jgi:hypothetical protein
MPRRRKCVAQTLVRSQPAKWWQPKCGQVYRHLLRFRYRFCRPCGRADTHPLDFLLHRGTYLQDSAHTCMKPVIADWMLGKPETTRADGLCDLPLPNELLRDYPCRTHPQSILKVCSRARSPRFRPATVRTMHIDQVYDPHRFRHTRNPDLANLFFTVTYIG